MQIRRRHKTVRQRRQGGFTLLEVVVAIVIFGLMTLMFSACLPIAAHSARYSSEYSQASSLVMHKINQLQEAGYTRMNETNILSLNIADSKVTGSLTSNANGDQSAQFEFTTIDKLNEFFPGANHATDASRPHGYIHIAPYTPSQGTSGGQTIYGLIQATVRITWQDARGQSQYFAATSLIPRTPIL